MDNVIIQQLPPDQFIAQWQQMPHAVLLDTRTASEYQVAHLPNALLIDIKQPDFLDEIAELNPHLPYFVYCQVGVRSLNACRVMAAMGFTQLFNLAGGIAALQKNPVNNDLIL